MIERTANVVQLLAVVAVLAWAACAAVPLAGLLLVVAIHRVMHSTPAT